MMRFLVMSLEIVIVLVVNVTETRRIEVADFALEVGTQSEMQTKGL
jgi:hypothetical protein